MPTPTRWTPELILEEEDPFEAFAEYVQQQLGIPWPTIKDKTILRRKVKEFFAATPQADWGTLCRTVQYCKSRKIRFQRIWMPLELVREAYSRGHLPELGSTEQDASLEEQIKQALEQEERSDWRSRLLGARTPKARELALREWRESCTSPDPGLIADERPILDTGPSQVDLMTGGGDVQSVHTTARVRRGRPVRARPRPE